MNLVKLVNCKYELRAKSSDQWVSRMYLFHLQNVCPNTICTYLFQLQNIFVQIANIFVEIANRSCVLHHLIKLGCHEQVFIGRFEFKVIKSGSRNFTLSHNPTALPLSPTTDLHSVYLFHRFQLLWWGSSQNLRFGTIPIFQWGPF